MSDDLISAERIKYEKLCARLAVQKASEHEAVSAIHQLCDDNERLAVICGKRAAEITRLRAQVEQFRDTNRRMNRRLQLLEGWWQRKVDRSKSERTLLFDMWRRDHRSKEPNLKAMEEAAYQRGYADGFDAKFFIPKRVTYQQKQEAGDE